MYGAVRAVQSNRNDVTDWLPKSYSETGDLRWFRKHFVGDQFVVISWNGCRLGDNPLREDAEPDDPRIAQLARKLVSSEPIGSGYSSAVPGPKSTATAGSVGGLTYRHYFHSVTTARHLLDQLTNPPTDMPYSLAVERLKGSLIGSDGHETCVIATLTDAAIGKFRDVLGHGSESLVSRDRPEGVLLRALRECQIDLDTVHLGGPPVDNVAIDEEGERTLVRLAGFAGLIGISLAWWSLRSVLLTAIVFACSILSAAASLAVIPLTGATTDAITMSMPPLVYVLAISGAVHLINYYRDAVEKQGGATAAGYAVAHAWKPALFCTVTTACGLLSLVTSELTPIRKFGVYSALGVLQMLVIVFLLLPAALQRIPAAVPPPIVPRRAKRPSGPRPPRAAAKSSAAPHRHAIWHRFGGWIIEHHAGVTWSCVAIVLVSGLGVARLRTNVDLMKLFSPRARILTDYQWLETNVGRIVPMEVVLRFRADARRPPGAPPDSSGRLSLLERAEMVAAVQRGLLQKFGAGGENSIGGSLSAVTFIPPWPAGRHSLTAIAERSVLNDNLEKQYDDLLASGYLRVDDQDHTELWRISVRVAAFQDVDYGRFTTDLRGVVEPIIAQHNQQIVALQPNLAPAASSPGHLPPLSAVYTGVVPIVYKAQRALLDSLVQSTIWSFFTITPLVMFVARGGLAGMVAMLPNLLPVLVVFGGMGWLSLSVDIGSMMSASIALGVAVDDTIHYLTWFRRELNRSGDRPTAILKAYEQCATPTLQAALISGLGLSVFALSTFVPTRQFGYLMLAILLAGVIAELVLLPALLAGPLGRVFRPHGAGPQQIVKASVKSRTAAGAPIPPTLTQRQREYEPIPQRHQKTRSVSEGEFLG
jgi:predicted RND superfamily exporter protein